MKILMLADSMGIGGTERRLTELLKGLLARGAFEVELVVFSEKIEFKELFNLNIPIHILKRKRKRDISLFSKFFRLVKRIKPDIIHSWGSMATIYALPTKWLQNVLLVNAIITDAPSFSSSFDQRLVRFKLTAPWSDLILANSRAGLSSYAAPRHKSKYIYNGFDFKRLSTGIPPAEVRKKYKITDKKIVGMVGAFAPRKDYFTFIEIAQDILQERNDVIFLAVGDGPLLKETLSKVPPQFKKGIVFTGKIPDVEAVIQLFDIGILISSPAVHGEGISNAIMEYMAVGKPVIANENGGNAEIIVNDKTGFIVQNTDKADWINKILLLLDQPQRAQEMGRAGKKRIETTFNIDKMITAFVEIYKELIYKKIN